MNLASARGFIPVSLLPEHTACVCLCARRDWQGLPHVA